MTRREMLRAMGSAAFAYRIPLNLDVPATRALKFAVIADLHHGLAPDAMTRLHAFVDAVKKRRDIDLVVQMGDFCYSTSESRECIDLFNTLPQPKIHVLGNHDMDKVDKDAAMKFWGMKQRYGSTVIKGWRFIVLDLNHFKKDGKLVAYANGNYFTDSATHNLADPDQLDWLGKELSASKEPVILLSHQPLGFPDADGTLPQEQVAVLDVIAKTTKTAICLFGHLHVDRLEVHNNVPCYCVNSASYFWSDGMHPYVKPLYAFMELSGQELIVDGVDGEFVKPPPAASNTVKGRSASISNRQVRLH